MCIPGACGASKSPLGRALSRQLQLPVHRLDDDPDFRQLVEPELPDVYRWTDPQWWDCLSSGIWRRGLQRVL